LTQNNDSNFNKQRNSCDGHHSTASVTNYSMVSEKQQAKISRTLSDLSTGTGGKNKTSSSQHAENSAIAVLSDGQQS